MVKCLDADLKNLAKAKGRVQSIHAGMMESIQNMKEYKEMFKVTFPKGSTDGVRYRLYTSGKWETKAVLDGVAKIVKAENAEKLAARKERDRVAALEAAERRVKWLAGENVSMGYSSSVEMLLRVKGEDVETSRGAKIPLTVAHKLWSRIKAGTSVDGMNLGHYTVGTYADGVLTAGCHKIPLAEMTRLAAVLGW